MGFWHCSRDSDVDVHTLGCSVDQPGFLQFVYGPRGREFQSILSDPADGNCFHHLWVAAKP